MRLYKNSWLASCNLVFIVVLFGATGVTVPVVYLSITHAVMWFVRYIEPAFATSASYTGTVVSFLIAFLAIVQYNACGGSALECMAVAWRSGAAFITAVACALVDLASIDNASVSVGPPQVPMADALLLSKPDDTGLRRRKKGV